MTSFLGARKLHSLGGGGEFAVIRSFFPKKPIFFNYKDFIFNEGRGGGGGAEMLPQTFPRNFGLPLAENFSGNFRFTLNPIAPDGFSCLLPSPPVKNKP